MTIGLKANNDGSAELQNGGVAQLKLNTDQTLSGVVSPPTTDNSKKLVTTEFIQSLFSNNQLLSANGYLKLPGGLILQWASVSAANSSSNQTVTFPTTFPNACLQVIMNIEPGADVSSYAGAYWSILSTSPSNVIFRYTTSRYIFAIGK